MAPHDSGRELQHEDQWGEKKDVKCNIQPKQETTGLRWPTLLTFALTFRIVAAAVASDRWPVALDQRSSVVAARGDTKDQLSHHTFSLFGYRQVRITHFFIARGIPGIWPLEAWHAKCQ